MNSDRRPVPDRDRQDPDDPQSAPAWHALEVSEVVAALGADPVEGLSSREAAWRLAAHGPNELPAESGRSLLRMITDQLADPMIALLMVAAIISGAIGEPADALAIAVIVILNAVIGVVQERRADSAMAALRAMSSSTATVIRDGSPRGCDAGQIVAGDLVVLRAGSVVPADLRLVRAASLRISEASLTGESQPIGKRVEAVADPMAVVGDRRSMAFRGTFVAQGRGWGLAVATGARTQLGAIAGLMASADVVRTPLQRRLTRFGGVLALAVVGICSVVFATGLLRGEDPALMFLTAISLAVAAVPEALPAVVAVTLALGARRMAQREALVRSLPAVETLGSVTWICSDKTGTLTENRMRAELVEPIASMWGELDPDVGPQAGDDPEQARDLDALLDVLVLCNDARLAEVDSAAIGDPTELAMLEAARDRGFERAGLLRALPRIAEVPFEPGRRLMATFHRNGEGRVIALVKGAPEAVLPLCTGTEEQREAVQARCLTLASQGLRVLAAARTTLAGFAVPRDGSDPPVPDGLTLVGLVGLIDPPRDDAAASVAQCRAAGIVPVMITGDHPATA
ncbi:MAG: HAD-IC family P-type ATPase, partial [Candidatus Nanopelagicales bacterium]